MPQLGDLVCAYITVTPEAYKQAWIDLRPLMEEQLRYELGADVSGLEFQGPFYQPALVDDDGEEIAPPLYYFWATGERNAAHA